MPLQWLFDKFNTCQILLINIEIELEGTTTYAHAPLLDPKYVTVSYRVLMALHVDSVQCQFVKLLSLQLRGCRSISEILRDMASFPMNNSNKNDTLSLSLSLLFFLTCLPLSHLPFLIICLCLSCLF